MRTNGSDAAENLTASATPVLTPYGEGESGSVFVRDRHAKLHKAVLSGNGVGVVLRGVRWGDGGGGVVGVVRNPNASSREGERVIGGARVSTIAVDVDGVWSVGRAVRGKDHATMSEIDVLVVGEDLAGSSGKSVGVAERIAVDFSIFDDGLKALGIKFNGFAVGIADLSLEYGSDSKPGLCVSVKSVKAGSPKGQRGKGGHGRCDAKKH